MTHDAPPPSAGTAQFVTGEAVRLDPRVARLGSRMLARAVDLVLQVLLFVLLWMVAGLLVLILGETGLLRYDEALFEGIGVVVLVAVVVGYPVTMESVTSGRTLGKYLLGLRVVREDGGPVRFRQALTRGLVGAAVELPGLLPPLTWLACIVTMLVSPSGKRFGDYAAGTLVIHDRGVTTWGWFVRMPPPLAAWAATLDLAGLDDDLALAVRHYLARYRRLRQPARDQLGSRLAAEVAAVTRPLPPPGTPFWAYLAAVHAERQRRALHRLAAVRARSAAVWPELAEATSPWAVAGPAAPPVRGLPAPPLAGPPAPFVPGPSAPVVVPAQPGPTRPELRSPAPPAG
ncbi:RDD family protein [Micromonospora sp. NPDC049559]|uniref:RDD family protein n=1 Tax=Micromonospora sp. NPDC049559 TaxID=3155923 RepID=UPI00343BBEF4